MPSKLRRTLVSPSRPRPTAPRSPSQVCSCCLRLLERPVSCNKLQAVVWAARTERRPVRPRPGAKARFAAARPGAWLPTTLHPLPAARKRRGHRGARRARDRSAPATSAPSTPSSGSSPRSSSSASCSRSRSTGRLARRPSPRRSPSRSCSLRDPRGRGGAGGRLARRRPHPPPSRRPHRLQPRPARHLVGARRPRARRSPAAPASDDGERPQRRRPPRHRARRRSSSSPPTPRSPAPPRRCFRQSSIADHLKADLAFRSWSAGTLFALGPPVAVDRRALALPRPAARAPDGRRASRLKQASAMEHLALHDPLTALPNRALLLQATERALGTPQHDERRRPPSSSSTSTASAT